MAYTFQPQRARFPRSSYLFFGARKPCPSRCSGKGSGGALKTAATDVWLNSGPGQRLDGRSTAKRSPKSGSAGVGAGAGKSSEDIQLAMAISASMGGAGGDAEGIVGGSGGGGGDEDDEVSLAIALSLSKEGSSSSSSSPSVYTPQPVPELQPKGPDVVRVQVGREQPTSVCTRSLYVFVLAGRGEGEENRVVVVGWLRLCLRPCTRAAGGRGRRQGFIVDYALRRSSFQTLESKFRFGPLVC